MANSISTKINRAFHMAKGPSVTINRGALISRGRYYATSGKTDDSALGKIYNGALKFSASGKGLTLYLINSEDVLNADSNRLPVYDANMKLDATKIIGFAGIKKISDNVKEGVIDRPSPSFMADNNLVGNTWKFDYDKGNGTFNKICLGSAVLDNRFNGMAVARDFGMDTDVNGNQLYGFYIRPGVTGLTGVNEILYGESDNDNLACYARYRQNIVTGEWSFIDIADPLYNFKLGRCDTPQVFYNNFLYVLDYTNNTLRKINPSTLEETVANVSTYAIMYKSLFLYDNKICISTGDAIYKYDPTTLVQGDYILLSNVKLPSEFATTSFCSIGNCGDNYVVSYSGLNVAVECTNLMDINGSMVDIHFGMTSAACYIINGKKTYFLRELEDDYSYTYRSGLTSYADDGKKSLKISFEQWGNMLEYNVLDLPVTKDDTMVKYVGLGLSYL